MRLKSLKLKRSSCRSR